MNSYNENVEIAKKYIEKNIKNGVSPEETAKMLNYSLRQLNRIFSFTTGLTLAEYIRWSKLAKAFFEVKNSDTSLIDIALKYGYECV